MVCDYHMRLIITYTGILILYFAVNVIYREYTKIEVKSIIELLICAI